MLLNRIKRYKTESYTTVSNLAVRDKRLSLKAKGFLLTVMSLPDTWDFSIRGITSIMPEGKAAIYAVIKELIHFGYCIRSRNYENGKIAAWVYTFYEQPSDDELLTENLEIENLEIENLDIDNRPQLKKDLNKDSNKEKNTQTPRVKKAQNQSRRTPAAQDDFPPVDDYERAAYKTLEVKRMDSPMSLPEWEKTIIYARRLNPDPQLFALGIEYVQRWATGRVTPKMVADNFGKFLDEYEKQHKANKAAELTDQDKEMLNMEDIYYGRHPRFPEAMQYA